MGIDRIDIRIDPEKRIGNPFRTVCIPVSAGTSDTNSPRSFLESLPETDMSTLCRRRVGCALYLNELSLPAKSVKKIFSGCQSELLIVGSDEKIIALFRRLPIEDDNLYSLFPSLRKNPVEIISVLGRSYDDIHPL